MSIGKFRRLPLHIRATLLFPVIPEGTCEFRRLVQFILVGAVYNNALTNCATRVCCACKDETAGVAVMYLTLRISRERHGRKNPLPFPHFAAVTCRQSAPDPPRERGDSQEGGNRRCLPSCAPAAGAATLPPSADGESPAEVQRKTLRPLGANTLTQFARPGQPMQEKEPPRQSEPTAAVRVPQSSGAGKRSRPDGSHLPGQAVKFPLDIPQSPTTILLRKRSN